MIEQPKSNNNRTLIVVIVLVVLCLCTCVALLIGGGAWSYFTALRVATSVSSQVGPVLTEVFDQPTATKVPNLVRTPVPTPLPGAADTLQALQDEVIPPSDLREIAMRLKGIPDIPEVVSETPANYEVGQELEFQVSNQDTQENFKITAKLIYKTDNVYFFAENGTSADEASVKNLSDEFQNHIYPKDREFFGSEWNPGIDGDPHVFVLYARGLGSTVGGYYSSADEYSKLAHVYSNEKEMFYVNADQSIGDPFLLSVLAHEFQHMIHWNHDRNEESWMNEGSSVLAEMLNGYDPSGVDYAFISDPDLQLNTWSADGAGANAPHYGAGFLFMAYFLDRFGNEATQALVGDTANGMQAVDATLKNLNILDPLTQKPITSVDVFGDWVIANFLGDDSVSDGRYAYHDYASAPTASVTDSFSNCPINESSTVKQFATDYYEIDCSGDVTLNFTGSQQVQVIPATPYSGRYAFWSHRNDESDTRMTHEFDLSGQTAATLKYRAWFNLEDKWDYAYLVVSTDNGATWKIVQTPASTDENPTGNALGWGVTGASGGGSTADWIEETVDLSPFAGQKVLVRFEYVTDAAVNLEGMMIDDISLPELNYFTDFETDDGGWNGEGFVRMDNLLPQKFLVQVINQGGETTVQRVELDASNQGSATLSLGSGGSAIVVVSGITPFTTEEASYEFEVR
ncbi:MAG: hypothetical protein ABI847_04295 [Anaerolineales bacterium]